ncbi:MAG: DUF481 domain-containing protein [Myxococcales bacterium]|nr:DUF481 domain-containing protein [Myxococcales bacterium]
MTHQAAIVGALLAGVALLAPTPSSAKITNVQALAGKPVEEGLSGRINLSANVRAGNVQLVLASAGTTLFHRTGDNVIVLNAKGAYGLKGSPGKWGDEPFRERLFEHLRYRRTLNAQWSAEAFVQHEYDRWRRLKLRALSGIGVRHDHKMGKRGHIAIGLAYMAQWEELLDATAVDLQGVYLEHRISSYMTGSVRLGERATLTLTCYAQPNIADLSDIRGLLESTLMFSLTDRLALKVTGWWAWDTAPPSAVRGYDVNTTVGFAFTI